jgi:single-stranded DNA-binding protein
MSTAVVSYTGRLVRDMERQGEKGPYKGALAVDRAIRKGKTRETKFINIDVWPESKAGQMIMNMASRGNVLKKGSLITVVGEPVWDVYELEGEERTREFVDVDRIEFVQGISKPATNPSDTPSEVVQTALQLGDIDEEEIAL